MIGTVIGRIGADAIVSTTSNGRRKISFTLAENDRGNTIWYRITSFDDFVIDRLGNYLKKGSGVIVIGEASASIYQRKDGENAISYDILSNTIRFTGGDSKNANADGTAASTINKIEVTPMGATSTPVQTPTEQSTPDVQLTTPHTTQTPQQATAVQDSTSWEDDTLPF